MTAPNVLNPHPPEFDRFLHASVGEDRKGSIVTVLSTLARLGLDPWKETSELATLERGAARLRLGRLLASFGDVPGLGADHGRVARELSLLLPERSAKPAASVVADARPGTSGAIWTVLAIVLVVMQIVFTGAMGSGE